MVATPNTGICGKNDGDEKVSKRRTTRVEDG